MSSNGLYPRAYFQAKLTRSPLKRTFSVKIHLKSLEKYKSREHSLHLYFSLECKYFDLKRPFKGEVTHNRWHIRDYFINASFHVFESWSILQMKCFIPAFMRILKCSIVLSTRKLAETFCGSRWRFAFSSSHNFFGSWKQIKLQYLSI